MTVTITPPTARVVIEQTLGDVNVATIFWLGLTPLVGVPADLNSLAEAMWNAWNSTIKQEQCTALELVGCKVLYYGSAGEYGGEYSNSAAGVIAEAALPADNSMVLSWEIARTYRGGHPRTYVAGTNVTMTSTPQVWTSGSLAAMLTKAEAFLAAVNVITTADFATVALGTQSKATHGAPRVDSLFEPYLAVSVQPRVCSQRRRLGPLS